MEKGFQLRNYHVRRGSRPKDSTPLYPITKAENIIGGMAIPHGAAPENKSQFPHSRAEYTLQPGTYYNFDEFYTEDVTVTPPPVTILFDDINNQTVGNSYVFRMTIPTSGVMNMTLNGVVIPDSAKDILDNLEKGHTYEFNIFDGVLMIADITSTE